MPITDDEDAIRALAERVWAKDGEIEFDPDAAVSIGEDNGAYVQAWVWVSFDALDDTEEED